MILTSKGIFHGSRRFSSTCHSIEFQAFASAKTKLYLASKFLTLSHPSAVSRCPFVEVFHIVIYHLTPQIGYGVGMNGL